MELKPHLHIQKKVLPLLLIVPYGIETRRKAQVLPLHLQLLIVPYGIETLEEWTEL